MGFNSAFKGLRACPGLYRKCVLEQAVRIKPVSFKALKHHS